MTESRSPVDAALDLLVYAPLGFALTAAEEVPKLAAKGRAHMTNQVTMARMVGQFAVTQGRKEIERRLAPSTPSTTSPGPPAPTESPPSAPEEGVGATTAATTAQPTPSPVGTPERTSPIVGRVAPAETSAGADVPPANGLAIPGYDSLSASQVVQRLAGLSADELDAVGVYEGAHRRRRTILTRVRQLQGS